MIWPFIALPVAENVLINLSIQIHVSGLLFVTAQRPHVWCAENNQVLSQQR